MNFLLFFSPKKKDTGKLYLNYGTLDPIPIMKFNNSVRYFNSLSLNLHPFFWNDQTFDVVVTIIKVHNTDKNMICISVIFEHDKWMCVIFHFAAILYFHSSGLSLQSWQMRVWLRTIRRQIPVCLPRRNEACWRWIQLLR